MLIYPEYPLKLRQNNISKNTEVWDIVRKKWITLTPEELVRQRFIHYLINDIKYPIETICVEKEIQMYNVKKRFDVAILNKKQEFVLVAECKAPTITLNDSVIEQILIYNLHLNAQCLVITNGIQQYIFEKQNHQWHAQSEIRNLINNLK